MPIFPGKEVFGRYFLNCVGFLGLRPLQFFSIFPGKEILGRYLLAGDGFLDLTCRLYSLSQESRFDIFCKEILGGYFLNRVAVLGDPHRVYSLSQDSRLMSPGNECLVLVFVVYPHCLNSLLQDLRFRVCGHVCSSMLLFTNTLV